MDDYRNYSGRDDGVMDWDDALESDGQEYILLPEGDYVFKVTGFERGRFPGSAKIPPCNKATLTLAVKTDEGTAHVKTDLILYRSLEWRISAFFRAIGAKQRGQRLVMDWSRVTGSRGYAHFKPRTYRGSDGQDHQTNDVARFYDYNAENIPEEEDWVEAAENADELPF